MSEPDDREEGFTIRDRRRFDSEGQQREGDDVKREDDRATAAEPEPAAEESIPAIDFATFLLSLSTSAMVHLGEAPNPEGKSQKNLQLARQTIDMLALMQQKTQGNRTEEEDRLLEQLLYDLRVRYVQAAR